MPVLDLRREADKGNQAAHDGKEREAMSWQPIETAPKDRRILLWIPDGPWSCCSIGEWDDDRYALKKSRPYWRSTEERTQGIRWMRDRQPTHWAELPEGPR